MNRLVHRLWRDRSGQALAEFALVLPLLLLLIAGIVEFGRGWNISQVVADAAREAARNAVVADETVDRDSVLVRAARRLAVGGVDPTGYVTCPATSTTAPIFCPSYVADGLWRLSGKPVTISVAVPYRMGFVGALLRWAVGNGPMYIRSQATMRNE